MIKSGDIISIPIKVKNRGNSNAFNVEVDITIPSGLDYYSATVSKGSYDIVQKKWSIGGLEVLEEVTMTLELEVVYDCDLPLEVSWNVYSTTTDFNLSNNDNKYIVEDSCCLIRGCMEFLRKKQVWIDFQYGNNEAQLENILKPFATIENALTAISLLDVSEQNDWQFNVSGVLENDLDLQNFAGNTIINFTNFITTKKIKLSNTGTEIIIQGNIFKSGSGVVLEFANNVNLESVILDLIIKRDTDDYAATQLGTPSGASVWIKSCLIESNKPFGLPVNGMPIVFKNI